MAFAIGVETLQKTIDWAYAQAVSGLEIKGRTVVKPVQALAEEYLAMPGTLEQQINRMSRAQHWKVGISGFVTGAGGLATLPAVPVDLANVIYTQLRMAATIACMYGRDPSSDEVRTFCYACLLGNGVREALAQAGVTVGNKMATKVVMEKVSVETLKRINQFVGMRLVTKTGQTGVIRLIRIVPLVGGGIGAGVNLASNVTVARAARRVFRA